MRKFVLPFSIILLLLVAASEGFSYELTKTRLYLTTTKGYKMDQIIFGINRNASNSLDTSLGENEVPPFLPPEGMMAGFVIFDTTQQENIWTYMDLRPFQKSDTSWVYHKLDCLLNGGDILTIRWNPIGPEIDSIFIIDLFSNGFMVNQDMKKVNQITMPNEFIKSFQIKVKYPNTPDFVEYQTDETNNITINNPVKTILSLKSKEMINCIRVIDELGIELITKEIQSTTAVIQMDGIQSGIYFVIINYANSTSIVKKIIKL